MGDSIHSSSGLNKDPALSQKKGNTATPQLGEQFAQLMAQKEKLDKKTQLEDAIHENQDVNEDAETSLKTKKVFHSRKKDVDDEEPSLHETIQHIQRRLIRLSKIQGKSETANVLKEMAQEKIDALKKEGYQIQDLKLPEDDTTHSDK